MTCCHAFERLDPAIVYANAWWRAHRQRSFGAPLRFNSETPDLPLQDYYLLCSDERNYLCEPEEYLRQEVRVSRVLLEVSQSRSMTVEEREAEMERRQEEENRRESTLVAGERGDGVGEGLMGSDARPIAEEDDRGIGWCFGELRGLILCTRRSRS
jgi:hypothetical protein